MVLDHTVTTQSAQETQDLGKKLATDLLETNREGKAPTILCLYGDLGSGKTTFVQGFAKGLGISSRILSPTFIIVRRYPFQRKGFFYHLDLYRIVSKHDLGRLGVAELFTDPNSFVLVEWAEKLESFLPKKRLDIQFLVPDKKDLRTITMKNYE